MTSTCPRGMTEQAAQASIDQACRMLRLPSIRQASPDLAEQATRDQMSYLGFLAELLLTEPRLCAAIVDRLTFAGTIIEMGAVSIKWRSAPASPKQLSSPSPRYSPASASASSSLTGRSTAVIR